MKKKAKINIVLKGSGNRNEKRYFDAEEVTTLTTFGWSTYLNVWESIAPALPEIVKEIYTGSVENYNFHCALLDLFTSMYGDRLIEISIKNE